MSWFFNLVAGSRLARTLILSGLGAVALLAAYAVITSRAYNRGWNDALATVAAKNAAAAEMARQIETDVDNCFDKGGTWNVAKGSCDTAD